MQNRHLCILLSGILLSESIKIYSGKINTKFTVVVTSEQDGETPSGRTLGDGTWLTVIYFWGCSIPCSIRSWPVYPSSTHCFYVPNPLHNSFYALLLISPLDYRSSSHLFPFSEPLFTTFDSSGTSGKNPNIPPFLKRGQKTWHYQDHICHGHNQVELRKACALHSAQASLLPIVSLRQLLTGPRDMHIPVTPQSLHLALPPGSTCAKLYSCPLSKKLVFLP